MKIRGNASHIAEKYSALARDALATGDTITAENFLQHAEHYYRIIMAAQAQNPNSGQQSADRANGSGNTRGQGDQGEDGNDAQPNEPANGSQAEIHAAESGKANDKTNGKARKKRAENKAEAAQEPDDAPAESGDSSSESDNAAA